MGFVYVVCVNHGYYTDESTRKISNSFHKAQNNKFSSSFLEI